MDSIGKKGYLTLFAVLISALSILALDFENLEWSNNTKSYIGLITTMLVVFSSFFLKADEPAEEKE